MSTPPNASAPAAPKTPAAQPAVSAQPTGQTQAASAQPTPPERKMKIKVNGQDVEMTESQVIAYAQQGQVATQRFQEASKMKAEAEQVLKFAKANPKEFFERTGMNARQWAEEYLISELQNEAMSPEQRKARENEEKLRQFESEKKSTEDKARQEQMAKMEDEHRANYDQMFTKALMDSGLPRTQFTVKRMAELQLLNIKNKYELDAGQLAKLVREDYAQEQKSLLGAFDGNQLMEFLGPDMVKKLSKAQIAQLKAKSNPAIQSQGAAAPKSSGQAPTSWREFQKRNRNKA